MALREELEDVGKLLCFQLVYYLVKCIPAKAKSRRLLLVKTDEIGDYVLVRNFLGKFRESPVYKDHQITFIGNSIYRELFEAYDTGIVDEVIWLDKKRFRRDMTYRFDFLKKVRKAGFTDAINLVYSRSFRTDDLLIEVSTAANKIGMKTADFPRSKPERMLTPKGIYHHLLDNGDDALFDAIRNARFIEKITETAIHPVTTTIPVSVVSNHTTGAHPPPVGTYFVVFPGSGHKEKKWLAAHFAIVARQIADTFGLIPVVCGSEGDRPDCEDFIKEWKKIAEEPAGQLIDFTGKTTLPQFVAILAGAACTISVDTGAVHLAAAVQCPVFALFSGLHYGRFAPYPPDIGPCFYPVYPDSIDVMIKDGSISDNRDIALGLVKTIPPQKLIDKIYGCLPASFAINNFSNTGARPPIL
jgi:ADP-heptose:LPS heptosyltransferase